MVDVGCPILHITLNVWYELLFLFVNASSRLSTPGIRLRESSSEASKLFRKRWTVSPRRYLDPSWKLVIVSCSPWLSTVSSCNTGFQGKNWVQNDFEISAATVGISHSQPESQPQRRSSLHAFFSSSPNPPQGRSRNHRFGRFPTPLTSLFAHNM